MKQFMLKSIIQPQFKGALQQLASRVAPANAAVVRVRAGQDPREEILKYAEQAKGERTPYAHCPAFDECGACVRACEANPMFIDTAYQESQPVTLLAPLTIFPHEQNAADAKVSQERVG